MSTPASAAASDGRVVHVAAHHLGVRPRSARGQLGRPPRSCSARAAPAASQARQQPAADVAAGAGQQEQCRRRGAGSSTESIRPRVTSPAFRASGIGRSRVRVAVVGAGLAGLAAARELRGDGHEVVVLEKSRGLGGRLASRRAAGTVLDHGSPVLAAPPGTALRAPGRRAPDADDRVDLDDGIAFATGATRLPKLMAGGLDVRLGVRLAALRDAGGAFELGDEQGNTHGAVDAVVVTAPAPQAADLLERSPEGGDRVRRPADAGLRAGGDGAASAAGGEAERAGGERPAEGPLAEVRREAVKGRRGRSRRRAGGGAARTRSRAPLCSTRPTRRVLEQALPALAARLGVDAAGVGPGEAVALRGARGAARRRRGQPARRPDRRGGRHGDRCDLRRATTTTACSRAASRPPAG